jgi:hypothetical protein
VKSFKLIVPVGQVPLGSTVTKKHGQVEYIVRDRLRAYPEEGGAPAELEMFALTT